MTDPAQPEVPAEEAVRLRAPPPRIARLSRPMVIALGAGAAVAVGAALVLALHGAPARPPEPAPEEPDARGPPSAVADAPKTYGDVPKLGPPLPGDLGRPIVAAQERGVDVTPPALGAAAAPDPAAAQARQARTQAIETARTSGLFNGGARTSSLPQPAMGAPALPAPIPSGMLAAPVNATPSDSKQAFLDRRPDGPPVSASRVAPPAGKVVLQAHSVIAAALVTAISSDLPGPVSAQVTRDVHDSLTGRIVVIPQGSRLLGRYDAKVAFGQRRVLLVWDRLVYPDGRSLDLDQLVGADAAGRSGLQDRVDAHWGSMGKAAVLSSLLGVGAELGSDDDSDLARALRSGVQDTVNQTGQQVVRRQLDVQPTLTLRAGLPLTILVTRDIVFDAPL